MPRLIDLFPEGRRVEAHRPWPRIVVSTEDWRRAAGELEHGRAVLLGLWGDAGAVHMALVAEAPPEIVVVTCECPEGRYPSVGALHPPAIRLERAIRSLYGLEAEGLPDARAWLDLGFWDTARPLGDASAAPRDKPSYAFLPVEGEGLHQVAVGPVHAGIIEPGHFRFTANGETVVRLEERLGYVHKGVERLMRGATLEKAARLAGRVSGDSTVAYALAFARSVEAALDVALPPRALHLRALMAELERLANHFGDIGAICNDASFSIMHAQCGILRERCLRAADTAFGHRLMMDRVIPGGVAADLDRRGVESIEALLDEARRRFPRLVGLYDNTTSLQDRTVGTGRVSPLLARLFGAGGYVGRASGRSFDARKVMGCAPYDRLTFEVPRLEEGDVNARVWIRIREVEQSLSLVEQILGQLPDGPVRVDLAPSATHFAEGLALAEGFRGDILAYVRFDREARLAQCHLRDPSWFQWPLLEAAIEGNIIADFPLCNKSFNCSYSGHDL
jgi:Ni,Fe-hydrogenase III large subunit